MLLKPLPIEQPGELVGIYSEQTTPPGGYRAFSYPNYRDLRGRATVLASVAAHNVTLVGVGDGTVTRRVFADIVSANYFEAFGSPLTLGRAFTDTFFGIRLADAPAFIAAQLIGAILATWIFRWFESGER